MAKLHYKDSSCLKNAPHHIKREYSERGEDGALCGYVRKNTTYNKSKVNCFYCKKALATATTATKGEVK